MWNMAVADAHFCFRTRILIAYVAEKLPFWSSNSIFTNNKIRLNEIVSCNRMTFSILIFFVEIYSLKICLTLKLDNLYIWLVINSLFSKLLLDKHIH